MTRVLGRITFILICFLVSSSIKAEEIVTTISWRELRDAGAFLEDNLGLITDPQFGEVLKIEAGSSKQVRLAELLSPGVQGPSYAIRGKCRYEGVTEKAYLESIQHFSKGNSYFSRTLGEAGSPLGALEGTSDWNPIALLFLLAEAEEGPRKIDLNVFIPEAGNIYLTDLELVQFSKEENPLLSSVGRQRWQAVSSRMVGVLGGVIGFLGGLVGIFGSMFASRGRYQGFVLNLVKLIVISGMIFLGFGVVILASGQSLQVCYPFLWMGALVIIVFGVVLAVLKKRYLQAELRKIEAKDREG